MANEMRKEPRYRLKIETEQYWRHQSAIDELCRYDHHDYVFEMNSGTLKFYDPGVTAKIKALIEALEEYHD